MNELDEQRNVEIAARNSIMKEIAHKKGCKYIDIYDELLSLQKYMHTDNIHFDRESNLKIAIMLKDEIGDK